MQSLEDYFMSARSCELGETIGMEVETSFLDDIGKPITIEQSQAIIRGLVENQDWKVVVIKGSLVVEIQRSTGDRVLYELGRHNIEVASAVKEINTVAPHTRDVLDELYMVAASCGAYPSFQPITDSSEDLLVVPDVRDKVWIETDGRKALGHLALASSVQFTVSVDPSEALRCVNALYAKFPSFVGAYPQDYLWKQYISESKAAYLETRYGGRADGFASIADYCTELRRHDAVTELGLVSYDQASVNIPLFLRSVWWHFRLRKFGETLCIEVRPLGRYDDDLFQSQLDMVLEIMHC